MINIEDVDLTPNPQALKFLTNENILKYETRNFLTEEDAVNDPLAAGIFKIEGVKSVFYMENFITIEKEPDAGWGQIQKPLINFLNDFDKSTIPAEKEVIIDEADAGEFYAKVNELLDTKVRPALAGDGGGLQLINIHGKIVKIHYQGACGGCPSAINGTLRAIEGLLRRDIDPEIMVIAG